MNCPVKTVNSPPPLTVSSLNYDILCKILLQRNLSFEDIVAFSQTCKENWTFVFDNDYFLKRKFQMTWPDYDENYMEKLSDYEAEFKLATEIQKQALDIFTSTIRDTQLTWTIAYQLHWFSICKLSRKHCYYVEDFLQKVAKQTCPIVENMIIPLRSSYDDATLNSCARRCLRYLNMSAQFVSQYLQLISYLQRELAMQS